MKLAKIPLLLPFSLALNLGESSAAQPSLHAGAAKVDISPPELPADPFERDSPDCRG